MSCFSRTFQVFNTCLGQEACVVVPSTDMWHFGADREDEGKAPPPRPPPHAHPPPPHQRPAFPTVTQWSLNVTCLSRKVFAPWRVGFHSSQVFESHVNRDFVHFAHSAGYLRCALSTALCLASTALSGASLGFPDFSPHWPPCRWLWHEFHPLRLPGQNSLCTGSVLLMAAAFWRWKAICFHKPFLTVLETRRQDLSVAREPFVSPLWQGTFGIPAYQWSHQEVLQHSSSTEGRL